ncbi:hypothetical protein OCU04_010344 [Sclerotinia nivalis]|uniref:Uncharacterized protein n=1 Tax=Sclerotinia nivalis TaxID=352851 RepID=A0A9X0AEC7_9HELO|nr:hypothetical protein OCU04_010344 [Sclerotinia nivalis]
MNGEEDTEVMMWCIIRVLGEGFFDVIPEIFKFSHFLISSYLTQTLPIAAPNISSNVSLQISNSKFQIPIFPNHYLYTDPYLLKPNPTTQDIITPSRQNIRFFPSLQYLGRHRICRIRSYNIKSNQRIYIQIDIS